MNKVSAPRQETEPVIKRQMIRPACYEQRPTGRVIRIEVRDSETGEWKPEERPETVSVLLEPEFKDIEDSRDVWIIYTEHVVTRDDVEAFTDSKGVKRTRPVKVPVETVREEHRFYSKREADEYYTACQRQGAVT